MRAGKPKVLVVDDETPYRNAISEILERSRLEVRFAADVHEAMAVLREWEPDALVLDVMLPGVSGLTLLKQLRADPAWKDLPIVLASALASQEDREKGEAAGADAYLTKPFTSADLRRMLRQFIPIPGTGELEAGGLG